MQNFVGNAVNDSMWIGVTLGNLRKMILAVL